MPEKIIRDPVHDVISFRLDQPLDALLFRLLNAGEFQRLRRVRQLGMASLVYPGADHSRYSHSLGVMETARGILSHLSRSFQLDGQAVTICVAAALLHDLGHGPFSHVFEHVSGIGHEEVTHRIITDPSTEVHSILRSYDRQLPDRVEEFLRCRPRRTFYCDILASQLDADRFDYLLRDNLMTGSRYGGYDLQWLLHALTIDEQSSRLAVMAKGASAIEAYLQSRYHMYRNVYFHKVVRSAEGMIRLALQRAKRLAVQDRLPWPAAEDSLRKALLGQQLSTAEFVDLDDVSMQHGLKQWANSEDAIIARLCRGLLSRQLYKAIDLTSLDDASAKSAVEAAREAVASAGGDPAYELFYDEPADTPYEIYDGSSPSADILVQDARGRLCSFAEISPMTSVLSRQLMFRRLHVTPELRDVAQRAVQQHFR